jgi:hypothetical protein
MKRALLLASLASAAALAGCPGSLEDPGRFAAQFGNCPDVPELLAKTCTDAGCHASTEPSAGLDLASPDVFGRLAGDAAEGGAGRLIDPDQPDASLLYTKLLSPPPFGSRMPIGGSLDDAETTCILAWIEASAKGGSP